MHDYQDQGGGRWSAPKASGDPAIRPIAGKDGLWRSDHANSDPLFGAFDAWTAFVTLDHGGNLEAAEHAFRSGELRADFKVVTTDDLNRPGF